MTSALDVRSLATELQPIELAGRPFGERVAERWVRIRDAWGQTVFYLFDAESWR